MKYFSHKKGAAIAAQAALIIVLSNPLYADEQPGADRAGLKARLAVATATAGEKLGHSCTMCHSIEKDGPNKIGPNLWNIVRAKHAHMDNFTYSDSIKDMREANRVWSDDELNDFLFYPRGHAPDTKMAFAGIKDGQDRANVIVWLHTLSDNPKPLPKAK